VDWCKSEFQRDLIAMLIEFRQIRNRQWNLLAAIDKELGLENWSQIQAINEQIKNKELKLLQLQKPKEEEEIAALNQEIAELKQQWESLPLQILLKQGKLLVLMDGFDEVPTSDLRRKVQEQVQQIAENYPNNRLILTCRTQIMTLIPVGFTLVEVADFKPEQVKQFVQNWFKAGGKSDTETEQRWETFDNAVGRNEALKELTGTPVLLSLICLVLQDEGEIPSQC
jgi:predicted NACHT family NTPase